MKSGSSPHSRTSSSCCEPHAWKSCPATSATTCKSVFERRRFLQLARRLNRQAASTAASFALLSLPGGSDILGTNSSSRGSAQSSWMSALPISESGTSNRNRLSQGIAHTNFRTSSCISPSDVHGSSQKARRAKPINLSTIMA